jgi:A/G-specific adenine glycosylase
MDLGATVCVRRNPSCARCPLAADCIARREGRQHELPARRSPSARRARERRRREVVMLIARREDGAVMLERRPPQGIWGGLWCLPEFASEDDARRFASKALHGARIDAAPLAAVPHAFTHFDLLITPLVARCRGDATVADADARLWYDSRTPARVGLPAPVVAIIGNLS